MKPRVLVPIADGSEEIEAACIIDVMRRATLEVTVASCTPDGRLEVTCSRGLRVVADQHISHLASESYQAIVLPGGMPGAEHLRDCTTLRGMLLQHAECGALIAAICAAPAVILADIGLLNSRQATAHPSFHAQLGQYLVADAPVVVDGNFITSQGPGTALQFALSLVEKLCDRDTAQRLASSMVLPAG